MLSSTVRLDGPFVLSMLTFEANLSFPAEETCIDGVENPVFPLLTFDRFSLFPSFSSRRFNSFN